MIVWHRPDGSGNVMEGGEVPDGLLGEGFPHASRGLDEIDRAIPDWTPVARDRDELLLESRPDANLLVTRIVIRPGEWIAAHPDGGLVVFDESELA